jgi:hypothetical protein
MAFVGQQLPLFELRLIKGSPFCHVILSEVVVREADDNAVEGSLPSSRMIVPIKYLLRRAHLMKVAHQPVRPLA